MLKVKNMLTFRRIFFPLIVAHFKMSLISSMLKHSVLLKNRFEVTDTNKLMACVHI